MILADLLQDQNPWWRDAAIRRARGYPVRRELQPKILDRILRVDDRRAVVLLGPRQVDVWRRLRSSIAARSIVRDLSSLGVDVSTAPCKQAVAARLASVGEAGSRAADPGRRPRSRALRRQRGLSPIRERAHPGTTCAMIADRRARASKSQGASRRSSDRARGSMDMSHGSLDTSRGSWDRAHGSLGGVLRLCWRYGGVR